MIEDCSQSHRERLAREIRGKLIELSHKRRVPHLASALSCVDLLVSVYWGGHRLSVEELATDRRDRFILSKGHAAPALYVALAYKGAIPFETLDTLGAVGSPLAEQPAPRCALGVEWATGSLGHGLGAAIGMLLCARIRKRDTRATVLMGDGECNEGSVWEGALFAAAQKLDKLTAIVDWNRWQATARSNETMALRPFREKWEAFGWESRLVDGHDIGAIQEVLDAPRKSDRPLAIVAETTKGKGVDFMEDDNNWHYRIPNAEELVESRRQLGLL